MRVLMLAVCLALAVGARAKDHADFWHLTTVGVVAAAVDVEVTQQCLREGTCYEANPFMPVNRVRAHVYTQAMNLGFAILGHHLKKHKSKYWWLPQAVLVGAHGVGIGFGVRF